jgi:hypothetical protein
MKEDILKLREEGKSYKQIQRILGCSLSTISYHCGDGQKEKNRIRVQKNRTSDVGVLLVKVNRFVRRQVYNKSRDFMRRIGSGRGKREFSDTMDYLFSVDDLLLKIGNNPICYLSGRKINITKPFSYNLDHIIPPRISIDNSLANCNIATREANMAKGDMTKDDFIQLCKEVCEFNGYLVLKNGSKSLETPAL